MSKMLVGSIDVSKIDKSKIKTTNKDGQPFSNGAKYVDVVVWINDTNDQYGNIASIQQNVSKEEREAGKKGAYIGNLKDLSQQSSNNTNQPQQSLGVKDDDDLPF